MVHVPLFVSDKFAGKSGHGLFGDVVQEVDWSVGQILDAIRRHKLDENTLVLFTSDNGPWLSYGEHGGKSGPLREGKGTAWDGGQREPTIAWWPGHVPAGTACGEVCGTIDVLPTVASLIGADLPDKTIDGKDITPLLLGEPGAKSPHEAFFFFWSNGLHAVRSGNWKLHFPHDYRSHNGKTGGTGGKPVPYVTRHTELALYDLSNDVGEQKNVADEHPEVVARLTKFADAMRAELGDELTKTKGRANRSPGRAGNASQ
jgi:arylsulfatase A